MCFIHSCLLKQISWLVSLLTFWYHYQIYRAAAIALSKRHAAGSLPVEDFNIELEDQSGQKVHLGSETDQRYDIVDFAC